MPSARPARMFTRAFFWNSRAERRVRIVSMPLISASSWARATVAFAGVGMYSDFTRTGVGSGRLQLGA